MDHNTLRLRKLRALATNYFVVLTLHLVAFFWNSTAEDVLIAIDIVIWSLVLAEVRSEIRKVRASSLAKSVDDLQPTRGGNMRASS